MYRGPAWSLIFEGSESDNQMLTLVSYDGEVYGHYRNMPVRIPRLLSERPFEHWATVPIAERREAELFERKMTEFQRSENAQKVFSMGHDVFATVRFGRFYAGFTSKFTSNPIPQSMPLYELSGRITKPPFAIKKSFRSSDCELNKLGTFLKIEGFEEYEKDYKYLCTLKDIDRYKISQREVEFDHNLERCIDHTSEKLLICDFVRLQSSDSVGVNPSKPDIRILIRSSSNVKPKVNKNANLQPILEFAPDDQVDQASAEPFHKIKLNKHYREEQEKLKYVRQKYMKKYKIKNATSEFKSKVEVHVSIVKNYELRPDGLVSTGIFEHEVTMIFPSIPSPEQEAEWKEISFALLEFAFKLGDELRVVQQTEAPQLQS